MGNSGSSRGAADQPLRAIHLVAITGRGGRGATALRMVRKLNERGHRVVLCCRSGGVPEEAGRKLGIRVETGYNFARGFHPTRTYADVLRLRKLIEEEKPHLLHAHTPEDSWVAVLAARPMRPHLKLIRSRGIVVPVRDHGPNRWLHNQMTDRLVVPCRRIREIVGLSPGLDLEKVVVVYDGVDAERFRPDRAGRGAAFRREIGVPDEAPLIGMIARVEPIKGHVFFLEAAAKVLKVRPDARFAICCDERTPGAVQALVSCAIGLGLSTETVRFTGFIEDVEKAYSALDVYVLPSLGSEGSSRGTLEAMASALPIVATNVGSIPELLDCGRTGRLVPPRNSDALAAAILDILRSPEAAADMGRAARERVLAGFTEDHMADRIERVYREVVAGDRR
ncbi:MAG: glycosyltransferase family 4 protein [Planctomycetota bacterium]|nr:glycosyltransferase family 4 protein [Planctomycetota bacterium]